MSNSNDSFFIENDLKKLKDEPLHSRLEDTISRCGLSKREFYQKIGISPQYWWRISWGIDDFPQWLKIKLCDEFGKPFIDFFLIQEFEKDEEKLFISEKKFKELKPEEKTNG